MFNMPPFGSENDFFLDVFGRVYWSYSSDNQTFLHFQPSKVFLEKETGVMGVP